MSKPIVFLDTNAADNKSSATGFLGNRAEIQKVANKADIALPRVVYDEIRRHIIGFLHLQKISFKNNPYCQILNIPKDDIDSFDHEKHIDGLLDGETIPFEIVDLKDKVAVYDEIYQHALLGTPPFEPKGDKGFKDALIAKTIDQYSLENPKREVFLFTKDSRLTEYFIDSRVEVIDGFEGFDREYSADKLSEELVVDRIYVWLLEGGNELSRKRAPDEQWISLHGDLVGVYREGDNEIILVLVDARAREPISYTTESPETVIEDLREAGSFQVVHTALANIDEIIRYMSIEHAKELASIMLANNQIYGIAQDDDVAQLVSELFELLDSNSETELAGEIKERYQLNLLTTKQVAELPF